MRVRLFFLILLCTSLFSACTAPSAREEVRTVDLKACFYWAPCDALSTISDAESLEFQKFSTYGIANIRRAAGNEQRFVWLKAVFEVPAPLHHKSLALFISYLHFADEVWVNGTYVGGYGSFPPAEKSALWSTHFYSIPETLLEDVGRNVILIKVFCRGKSGISDTVFIGEHDETKKIDNRYTFRQSTIYVFAEGGLFFTAVLFLLIFIWRKKDRQYLSFALLCLASMLFILPFFVQLSPFDVIETLSYLLFIKLTLCEGLYLMCFLLSSLVIEFIKRRETDFHRIVRLAILLVSSLLSLLAPNYDVLMALCPITLFLSVLQLALGFSFIAKSLFLEEARHNIVIFISAFIPLIVSIILDVIIKLKLQIVDFPYITLFGWQMTIVAFIILLSVRFNRAVVQNEYLNVRLRHEVLKQTRAVSKKNTQLTEEIKRAEADLEMASIVQRKFFPYPPKSLRGWDIAVSYKPLEKVSGDLYDYYVEKDHLNGFSLFDVSGHGIAASLVTMLAKNIIFQAFIRNMRKHETISRTLYEINDTILEAKGDIENYLTGVMFRFGAFDENGVCTVEMANAGHPNPILYSAKSNICDEIESGNSDEHHGAIGLDFITVSFPQVSFTMEEDDVLVFYTDGLAEGTNRAKEQFGHERIKKVVKDSFAKDAQSIMEDIIDAFAEFTNGEKRNDDITIVVLKRENPANYIEELSEIQF